MRLGLLRTTRLAAARGRLVVHDGDDHLLVLDAAVLVAGGADGGFELHLLRAAAEVDLLQDGGVAAVAGELEAPGVGAFLGALGDGREALQAGEDFAGVFLGVPVGLDDEDFQGGFGGWDVEHGYFLFRLRLGRGL
ncbi:hypothetical protein D9M70_562530 [compost metagenome]